MAHHRNALVYLDRLDEAQWAEREAVRDALEARTVDRLLAGDDAAAHAHRLDSFGAPLGRSLGRPAWTFRDSSYAYLSFELEPTGTGKPLELRLSVFAERDAALEVVVNGTPHRPDGDQEKAPAPDRGCLVLDSGGADQKRGHAQGLAHAAAEEVGPRRVWRQPGARELARRDGARRC